MAVLNERGNGPEGWRYERLVETAEIVRAETQRLLHLVKTGVPDSFRLEDNLWHLCYKIRPALSLIQDPHEETYMYPRKLAVQSAIEFDSLMERGILHLKAQPPEDKTIYGDISEFVSAIVQEYRCRHPQIDFVFDSDKDYRTIFCPMSIKLALENLLNNAVQALPPTNGRIVIGLNERFYGVTQKPFEEIRDGIYVGIEVRDNGSGIPGNMLDQLQHSPVTTKENGSGLGLVSARNSIIQHRGYLFVESEEGHGAKFTALLPSKFPPPARIPKIA